MPIQDPIDEGQSPAQQEAREQEIQRNVSSVKSEIPFFDKNKFQELLDAANVTYTQNQLDVLWDNIRQDILTKYIRLMVVNRLRAVSNLLETTAGATQPDNAKLTSSIETIAKLVRVLKNTHHRVIQIS